VSSWSVLQFRVSRRLGRVVTRTAALLTLGKMPPFVSTSGVVIQDGRVLMVSDPIRNELVLPGGHLKWDEDPQKAVAREVREETGILIEPRDLLGVYSGKQWSGERGIVRVIYLADAAGGNLQSSAEGEAQWVDVQSVARADTRDAPLVRAALERVAEGVTR
jgi:ADP-ribose pyrophosphatase YjhB (NUDIX family)